MASRVYKGGSVVEVSFQESGRRREDAIEVTMETSEGWGAVGLSTGQTMTSGITVLWCGGEAPKIQSATQFLKPVDAAVSGYVAEAMSVIAERLRCTFTVPRSALSMNILYAAGSAPFSYHRNDRGTVNADGVADKLLTLQSALDETAVTTSTTTTSTITTTTASKTMRACAEGLEYRPGAGMLCAQCSDCADSQYEVKACSGSADRQCLKVTECRDDQYELEPNTITTDRVCKDCTKACPTGKTISRECSRSTDIVCSGSSTSRSPGLSDEAIVGIAVAAIVVVLVAAVVLLRGRSNVTNDARVNASFENPMYGDTPVDRSNQSTASGYADVKGQVTHGYIDVPGQDGVEYDGFSGNSPAFTPTGYMDVGAAPHDHSTEPGYDYAGVSRYDSSAEPAYADVRYDSNDEEDV